MRADLTSAVIIRVVREIIRVFCLPTCSPTCHPFAHQRLLGYPIQENWIRNTRILSISPPFLGFLLLVCLPAEGN